MPLVPLRKVLDHAAANNYGVAAFNVNNMEQIQAIMEAAKETDSPVIIQASRGARSYSQDAYLKHLMLAAAELYPQIPVVMHQGTGHDMIFYRGWGSATANLLTTQSMAARATALLSCSGVLERHPALHVVLVEVNAGWLAWT